MLPKKKSNLTILLILAVLLISGCSAISQRQQATPTPIPVVLQAAGVVSEGRLVPQQYVGLSFKTGGIAGELLVEEGDSVQAGQIIARLDQRETAAAAVASAETELLNARQALKDLNENAAVITAAAAKKVADAREAVRQATRRLDNLNSGSVQTDIDSAAATVVILKDRLDQANKDFAAYENKPEDNLKRAELLSKLADARKKYDNAERLLNNLQGTASEIDLAVAEANLALANAQLALAEEEYEKVKDGPDVDDLEASQARLRAAETALAAAQAAYDDSEMLAPISGTIAQLNLKEGELVSPGQTAVVIGDFGGWIVETDDLTEIEVPKIRLGDEALLEFDALPDLQLSGVVESVSDLYAEKRGDITYTARIRLTESDPRLRWGMTVVVHIQD